MVQLEDNRVLAVGKRHGNLVVWHKGRADNHVAGKADALHFAAGAIPHAEGMGFFVNVGKDHKAAIRRPCGRHGLAGHVGDLPQVAPGGLDQPHVGAHLARLFYKGKRGAEEGAIARKGFKQVGAESVGHFGQVFGSNLGVLLAEKPPASVGFKSADLHGAGAAVALGPVGRYHNVRPGKLEALEIEGRRLIPGQNNAAKHCSGIGKAHKGQKTQVFLHDFLQVGAHAVRFNRGALDGGRQGKVNNVLPRTVNVHAHGGLRPASESQPEPQGQEKKLFFHGVSIPCSSSTPQRRTSVRVMSSVPPSSAGGGGKLPARRMPRCTYLSRSLSPVGDITLKSVISP